jgi:hypothetical protein
MAWSVSNAPEVATGDRFGRDFGGEPAGKTRKPGPLLDVPAALKTVSIDPLRVR